MRPTRKSGRSWKLFRIYFRRFRFSVWAVVIAFLCAILYLNQIGLPDFAKRPLVEKLRARGLDLQFTRLRLRFPHGIVAENVLFGQAGDTFGPTFSVKEVQVRLDYLSLAKMEIQVKSLLLQQGRLNWPINETNQPLRALTADQIQTELRFLPGDVWELDRFKARFSGANIQLAGVVTNASVVRDWKMFKRSTSSNGVSSEENIQKQLRQLADVLDQIQFTTAPELAVEVFGDARNVPGFGARISVRATGAKTAWGEFGTVDFLTRLHPPEKQEASRLEIILRAANARTPWATAADLDATLFALSESATNFIADLHLKVKRVETDWGDGSGVHFTAQWRHTATNAIPLTGKGRLEVEEAATPWGAAKFLDISATLSTLTNAESSDVAESGSWKYLTPYALKLNARAAEFLSPEIEATNLHCAAEWERPTLQISRLSGELLGGSVSASATLDITNRELEFAWASDFNALKLPILVRNPRIPITSFEIPPAIKCEGRVTLPPWTNQNPDWAREISSTARFAGTLGVTNFSFSDAKFISLLLNFSTTNQQWRIANLEMIREEGRLASTAEFDQTTGAFAVQLQSTLDVNLARLFVPKEEQRAFDLAGFTRPPELEAEFKGQLGEPSRFHAKSKISLTNFTFRGQSASGFQSAIEFTNNVLTLIEPRIQRGEERISAALVSVDFGAGKIFVTNGFGTANPLEVARAIGPVAGAWFEPYHFLKTPTSRVNGSISFDIDDGVDLHFDFEGGPFEWWLFKLPRVAGRVNWVNDSLTLKNVRAEFYEGQASGEAKFTFPKGPGTGLTFDVVVNNADLHLLLNDLRPPTNKLAGLLSGHWAVIQGNAPEVGTWVGRGELSLRNGLLMEIPVFGVLTPALENIAPGLANNRLSEGNATFVLTNGIIHSDDLDIRASGMRLQYRGDVDLEGRVNARAEAEFLRDTWVVGRVLSLALWPVSKVFEYKISGTLSEPKMEPLYFLPRLILMPLHPIESMRELRNKGLEGTTNSIPTTLPSNDGGTK